MALAAVSEAAVVDQLISMFVSPARASTAVSGERQHRDVNTTAAPQVTLGYKVIPVNLVNGQVLAEPQVLGGTAALALHGLLMKLHAQSMQEQLPVQPSNDEDLAAQQSAAVSAAAQHLANHASSNQLAAGAGANRVADAGGAAEIGNDATPAQHQQPNLDGLPDEVLKLLPKELKEQGPEVLLQQLEAYLKLREQLASHEQQRLGQPEQQESHKRIAELHSYLAGSPTAGTQQGKYQPRLHQSVSDDSSTSCTDPLEVSPEHRGQQQGHRGRLGTATGDAQRWGSPVDGAAAGAGYAAADYGVNQRNGVEGQPGEQHLRYRSNTVQRVPCSNPDGQQPPQRSSDTQSPGAAGDGGAAGLKRKRAGAPSQYRGVRLRPWGTYGAEIRDPQTGTRVWLGSFSDPDEAAMTYDAAVRELRGPKGVTNLPEPPEPDRSKYQSKVRELLNKAQAKPGAKQQQVRQQQQQQVTNLQELQLPYGQARLQGVGDMQAVSAAGGLSRQQLLQQQYQQPEYWRRQDDPEPQHSSSPADPDAGNSGMTAGIGEELEQVAGSSLAVADLGSYDQQAQQLAEELRRMQDVMLGRPAAAAVVGGPGSGDGMGSPTALPATEAFLELRGGGGNDAE